MTPSTPTFFVLPNDDLLEKNLSTVQEIRARKGLVLAITHAMGDAEKEIFDLMDEVICVPKSHEFLDPILMLIPLQLLAYHIALARSCNVDQPRNLAKSVTVE